MKKLIFIPLLFLFVFCEAQFTKGGGGFLKTGSSFMTATVAEESVTFCDEFQTVYDEMTDPPTGDTITWMDDMVYSLDSIGYWDRTKLFYVMATRNSTDALLNWISPGTYNLTDAGSTGPVFTKYQGYTGGSADYLSTGWSGTDSTLVSDYIGRNRATFGSWTLATDANGKVFGAYNGDLIGSTLTPVTGGGTAAGYVNSGSRSDFGSPASGIGCYMVTRRGRLELEAYYNGSSLGSDNEASQVIPNQVHYVLANNNNGTADSFYTGNTSIIFAMNTISDTEATNIYNILHRFMTRIGQ